MKNLLWISVLCLLAFSSCSSEEEQSASVIAAEDVKELKGIRNSTLINNPVTANEVITADEAAQITFEEEVFDFGDIVEGDAVEHVFKFTNTGKNPLIINNARGSCGCTVPEWPRDPIAPGQDGEIQVKFNSRGKQGEQNKSITISANTLPNKTVIRIVGGVEINPETEKKELEAKEAREEAEKLEQ
ncbi:MAG: DUF1573 domain-containing protein [Aureispira sp.]